MCRRSCGCCRLANQLLWIWMPLPVYLSFTCDFQQHHVQVVLTAVILQAFSQCVPSSTSQAYLEKAPGDIVSGGHLEGVLGVFQKLLASRAHDHEGFYVLNSLMEFLPLDVFRGYLPTIWTLLFRRCMAGVQGFGGFQSLSCVSGNSDC